MKKILLLLLFQVSVFAQGYTSYFTGNPVNSEAVPEPGLCLMGGATEHDEAMRWLLRKANGGDVVVLRSSGSDGYNDYLYSELGIAINSVETLVITSVAGATNSYVLDKVAHAEMIWIAGGDQYNYVSYFKDNALEDLLNAYISIKRGPIGGTSAGMAILGSDYFSAQNGSVSSAQALNDPYHDKVTLGSNDFLAVPFMQNTITDTHYDNPDRRGRQSAFMARLKQDSGRNVRGIACNEYVAVCIGSDGRAYVYGDYPNYDEFAYFIQPNCAAENVVENCTPNNPLTWKFNQQALKAYKVPGTMNGANYFDLNDWENATGSGGSWEHWWVNNGGFAAIPGSAPECSLAVAEFDNAAVQVSPNPFQDHLSVKTDGKIKISITDLQGRTVYVSEFSSDSNIDTSVFAKGSYVARMESEGKTAVRKLIKK